MPRKYFKYCHQKFDDAMDYFLFEPTKDLDRPLPLIVWLHGSGEVAVDEAAFLQEGLPDIITNWPLKPFGAYIICPQLIIEDDVWAREDNVNKLMLMINQILKEKRIDKRRIILSGHSLGAMGAMYVAERIQSFFSCLCVLSGYEIGVDLTKIKIPVLGIVGDIDAEEDSESIDFMKNHFISVFSVIRLWEIPCSHADVPKYAFLDDSNLDGRSDLIHWMFSHKR